MLPSVILKSRTTGIGHVGIGKTLAGSFYSQVIAVMIFPISWVEVIHWDMVMLFVIGGGFFSVVVGLVLGSFFEKQQDMVGWLTALLLLLVGAVWVRMLGMELPVLVESIPPCVPSVAMAEVCNTTFSEIVPTTWVWTNLWIILTVSLPLYAIVI